MESGPALLFVIVDDDLDDYNMTAFLLEQECPSAHSIPIISVAEWDAFITDSSGRKPKLILMDFYLPGANGLERLKQLKQTPTLRTVPVIVWSASVSAAQVEECYEAGAAAFMWKPTQINDFTRVVKSLCDFWIQTATLPR